MFLVSVYQFYAVYNLLLFKMYLKYILILVKVKKCVNCLIDVHYLLDLVLALLADIQMHQRPGDFYFF